MNNPIITTIVPTFQRPERLKKAIQSVLNQTYPHFQLCVYDNASADETKEVVAEFSKDSRVRYYAHEKNIGPALNFQFGLSRVETPFFSFLSDDDYLLPEFYEETLRGFEKFPESLFSMGAVIDVDDEGKTIDVILSKWPDKEFYRPPDGLLEMIGKYSNWTGILFKKEIIEKVGILDLKLEAIDVDFVFRAAAQVPFAVSKKKVAVFVQHPTSYSGVYGIKLIWPGWPMMMEKLQAMQLGDRVQDLMLRDFWKLLAMNGFRSLTCKKFDEAKKILDLLGQYNAGRSHLLPLKIGIRMCQVLPMAHRFLISLFHLRRMIRRLNGFN